MDELFKKLSQGSTIIILSFFTLLSIVNSDLKVLVYLGFLLIAYGITWGTAIIRSSSINNSITPELLQKCTLGLINFFPYIQPSLQAMFLSFSCVYIFLPMIFLSSLNYGAIIFFGLTYIVNSIYNLSSGCTDIIGFLTGTIIGGGTAVAAYFLLLSNDLESLLYFSDDNRPEKCKVIKNNFRCEIISKT